MKTRIILSADRHRNKEVILFRFDYDTQTIDLLRNNFSVWWSKTKNCWWIARSKFDYKKFREVFAKNYEIVAIPIKKSKPKPESKPKQVVKLPVGYLEKLERLRYSESTIRTYCQYFAEFCNRFAKRDLKEVKVDEINNYLLALIKERNISISQQNQRINAIKFYYEKVLGRKKEYFNIERPRKEKILPNVLSKEEIFKMIKCTGNIKHRCILVLIYSCGLRRSEAINMQLTDIDSKRMLVKVRAAKGKKDRYVQLSTFTLEVLRAYYKREKPKRWVFEGPNGTQYSAASILKVVKQAARRAGVKKRVYTHILRHSYATHHLEQGTDLRYIQEWLGHGSSKTTEIYTHVSKADFVKFKNPIDDLLNSS